MTGIIMTYPPNLGIQRDSDGILQEQLHSIQFNIITRELTKTGTGITDAGDATLVEGSGNRVSFEDGGANAIKQAALVAGGATLVTWAAANPIQAAAVGIVAGAGIAYADITEDQISRAIDAVVAATVKVNRRIMTNKVIRLYIPASPKEQYGATWADKDMGIAGAFADASNGSLVGDIRAAATTSGAERDRAIRTIAGMTNITSAAGFDFRLTDILELGSGKVANPNKASLFKGMNFRNFQYSFKFAPKNKIELDRAYAIIYEFKKNMHPERSEKFFLQYPSEFQIQYQYANKHNKWLTKIADCALMDMTVDYGAGGAFTTIQGTEGAPSEITMTLQFKELEVLTSEWFADAPTTQVATVTDDTDDTVAANAKDEKDAGENPITEPTTEDAGDGSQ